jgi:hypothetical protein
MYTNDSGAPIVFGKLGDNGGSYVYGAASIYQGVQPGGVDYGTIQGIKSGESGYYRPE